jgi:hypothetical protein
MSNMLNIKRGGGSEATLPIRVVLYGPHGVGKTGFGADAPAPIFLPVEDGLDAYPNAVAFPKPNNVADVLEAIALLSRGVPQLQDRKTLVIDTADALDALIVMHVRQEAKGRNAYLPSLEEIGGGYGKGAKRVLEVWQDVIARIEAMQAKRGMNVVILAHASTEKVKQPNGEDVTRHSLKLTGQAAAHVKEWTRDLLFTTFEVRRKGKWVKQSLSVAKRVIYTVQADSGAFDAKNRVGLPPMLPLSFAAYADARAAGLRALAGGGAAVDEDLVAEVAAALEVLPQHLRVKAGSGESLLALAKAQGNGALRKLLNWAITKADEIAGDVDSVMTSGVRPREDAEAEPQPNPPQDPGTPEDPKGAVNPPAEVVDGVAIGPDSGVDESATFDPDDQGDAYEGPDPTEEPEDPQDQADGLQQAATSKASASPPVTQSSASQTSVATAASTPAASGSASGGTKSGVRKPARKAAT